MPPALGIRARRDALTARVPVRRLFLWLLAAALLPLLLLATGRSVLQLQRTQESARTTLSQRAVETARQQSEVVRTTHAMLLLLAEHPDVRAGGLFCDIALTKVAAGFAAISNVSRFGADGTLLCSSTAPVPAMNVAGRPWWPAARRHDAFFLTGPIWGQLSRRQVLVGVLPMHAEDGGFTGIVSASIDMDWVARSLRSTGLGPDALALVVDGRGDIVAASRPSDIGDLDVTLPPGAIGKIESRGGDDWIYAVAPMVHSFDGRQSLYIAYAMPETRLFSAGWFQAGFLLLPLLAVLIASLVIWFGTNALVLRWLRQLQQLAQGYSGGDYRARLPALDGAPAEIRDLAAAFYRMGRAADRRDRALRSAMARQKLLVREVHHRVKNNLQIVMSLLSLQAARSDAADPTLGLTRLRISTLAFVHRLFYEAGEEGSISSSKLLGGVCKLLDQFLGKRADIEVHCHIAEIGVALDTAIPLCMWLVEATSNAWLHAFPGGRGGAITIRLTLSDDEARLDVSDDGVGFAIDGNTRREARGLRILASIAKQLGGHSALESTSADGTRVRLCYPLHQPGADI